MENNEEKPTTEDKPKEDTREGDDPKVPSAIILARTENERMEANIKRQEELISRQEELAADNELGGTAEAGKGAPIKKEESDHNYRVRIQKEMADGKTEFGN